MKWIHKISKLLGFDFVENDKALNKNLIWNESPLSENWNRLITFLEIFDVLKADALRDLWSKFETWNSNDNEKLNFNKPIAIGLTSGYSAALKEILKDRCEKGENIRGLRIILIQSSELLGDEEILRAELMADFEDQGLRCDIMPFDVIEKKEIQLQLESIFVGIESINEHGDIVHPRGGSDIISKIKKYNSNIEVFAFGESYKVQEFKDEDIDYTKLSLLRHNKINYVTTDHGVHERKEYLFNWDEIDGKEENKFIEFLREITGIEWDKPNIEKINNDQIIKFSSDTNNAEISLSDDENKALLKINNETKAEFFVKIKKGSKCISIEKWKIENELKDDLRCCIKHWRSRLP